MNELSEIRERLVALETLTNAKWDAHDKRSEENWDGVKAMMGKVEEFIQAGAKRKEECMKQASRQTYTAIKMWLGIPATLASIIGVIVIIIKFLRF